MRRWKLIAGAGLTVLIAIGVVVPGPRPDRITPGNYARIQVGMHRAEVEVILGAPGDYRAGPGETRSRNFYNAWQPDDDSARPLKCDKGDMLLWVTDSMAIRADLDRPNKIEDFVAFERRRTQGPLDNLLWRAKRLWRRWFPE
jgi:hypothetical protein